jgi:hypothetical protein
MKRIILLAMVALLMTAMLALLGAGRDAAHPHEVSNPSHDQKIAKGQNHPAFVSDTGLITMCEGVNEPPDSGPAGYGLETAHRGPDAGTPGKGDGGILLGGRVSNRRNNRSGGPGGAPAVAHPRGGAPADQVGGLRRLRSGRRSPRLLLPWALSDVFWGVTLVGSGAMCIAILRYRHYEMDLPINRTLVYDRLWPEVWSTTRKKSTRWC